MLHSTWLVVPSCQMGLKRFSHLRDSFIKRAENIRKATAAVPPFVDKSMKVSALQSTDETPSLASVTLTPDFDGYLFAIAMDSSWNETLCPLMRLPTALKCHADVSWSFCVPVDRFWMCCHWLPAFSLPGRRGEPDHRALWREGRAIQHCRTQRAWGSIFKCAMCDSRSCLFTVWLKVASSK